MATFDDAQFVQRLIEGNGRISPEDTPDNPWAVKIVRYFTVNDTVVFGVVFGNEPIHTWDRYDAPTEWVRRPRVIWTREDGVLPLARSSSRMPGGYPSPDIDPQFVGVPCGHPPEPQALRIDGYYVCHCGQVLEPESAQPHSFGRAFAWCSRCDCHVQIGVWPLS